MNQGINAYLTFSIGDNSFGIHVEKVVEIKEYTAPKAVPESMVFVKGVMDHREQIIPVIDAARKFNLGEIELTPQTCVVVLDIEKTDGQGNMNVGIIVDAVSDVFEADSDQLKSIENDYKPGYIASSYQKDEDLVMILNADKVFNEKDIIAFNEILGVLKK